ncbi:MAG: DUF4260 family protein [Anaerolineales bacterium]|nr:DUF4260 family protein [Anaerolineales bacterium]
MIVSRCTKETHENLFKFKELGFALFLFSELDYGWGRYALWFFALDLSMIGYLANLRSGAWITSDSCGRNRT